MTLLTFFLHGKWLYACSLYDNFFETVNQINANKKAAKLARASNGGQQNSSIKLPNVNNSGRNGILLLQGLTTGYVFFATVATFFYDRFPPLVLFAFCDYFYLEGIPHIHRTWLNLNAAIAAILTHLAYFCNSGATYGVLCRIYRVNGNGSGSGSGRSGGGSGCGIEGFFITSTQSLFRRRLNVAIVRLIDTKLLPLARLFLMLANFYFALGIAIFGVILHFKISKLGLFNHPASSLAYVSFLAFGLLWATIARLCFEMFSAYGIRVALLCYVFSLKLTQMWAHLHEAKVTFFSELRLRLHLRYNADILVFLADFNRLHGRAMWIVFLVLYPENATNWIIVMRMMAFGSKGDASLGRMAWWLKTIIIVAAVGILLMLKLIHYNVIGLTRRIFSCAHYLTSVAVHSRSIHDVRIRLKLERYLDLFHSQTKPHTVTYGRHGNVTKASFGKVILYSSKSKFK